MEKNARVVVMCCKLHNFIVDNDVLQVPPPSNMDANHHTEVQDRYIHLQDECDLDELLHRRRRDLDASDLRRDFRNEIEADERRRPVYS